MPAARASPMPSGNRGPPASQRWGEGNRDVLWAHHATVFIRIRSTDQPGVIMHKPAIMSRRQRPALPRPSMSTISSSASAPMSSGYNNLSVAVGFKKRYATGIRAAYYLFGLRGLHPQYQSEGL